MVLRNKYFQISLAITLGIIVNLLPRPEGTEFSVTGDPDRLLATQVEGRYESVDWEGTAASLTASRR